jgi:phosphoglycerate dehydrogenase-like enzyme
MPAPPARPVTVLVYHPLEADHYARLVQAGPSDAVLRVCATHEQAAAAIAEADVLYAWYFPRDLYAGAGRLRWVQAMGAGVEWALVPSLPSRVTLTRTKGIFGPWMVEYALGWMLWVTQRMTTYIEAQRERRWLRDVNPDRLGGRTLAVIGLGDIGRAVARAVAPLGMHVVGVSASGRPVRGVPRVHAAPDIQRVLHEADFVVITVPLTPETRGLIGREALAAMRPSAWLLNMARGPIVDEGALLEALQSRRIGGAILDVFQQEPLPAEHPFWRLDNVVVTPHIAGPSTAEEIAPIFEDNLARFLAGRPLRFVVDRRRGY